MLLGAQGEDQQAEVAQPEPAGHSELLVLLPAHAQLAHQRAEAAEGRGTSEVLVELPEVHVRKVAFAGAVKQAEYGLHRAGLGHQRLAVLDLGVQLRLPRHCLQHALELPLTAFGRWPGLREGGPRRAGRRQPKRCVRRARDARPRRGAGHRGRSRGVRRQAGGPLRRDGVPQRAAPGRAAARGRGPIPRRRGLRVVSRRRYTG
mmetsp:Transcript_103659/g.324095  ORF Transcript_103659/g.324095 Transcript_103659/m.324095 type:complete len:204 (-) Transcript_103659:230-841(-)